VSGNAVRSLETNLVLENIGTPTDVLQDSQALPVDTHSVLTAGVAVYSEQT